MFISAIKYRNLWLAPGSKAHQLHSEKKFDELDKHIKEVLKKEK